MPVNRNGVASSDLAPAKRVAFERTLGLPEAVGPSLSIVGPSMAMAFNVCSCGACGREGGAAGLRDRGVFLPFMFPAAATTSDRKSKRAMEFVEP